MKISAMPAGSGGTPGVDLGNIHIGATASAEKLAAAKAIALGQEPPEPEKDSLLQQVQNVRRIKMRTNYSTNRDDVTQEAPQAVVTDPAQAAPNSTISDKDGQAQAAVESTQPLSPQFAALARERRQLQVMKQELAKERQAMDAAKTATPTDAISKADLLANPLKIFDLGLTYDQLTEAILANQGNQPDLKAFREELKADMDRRLDERLNSQAQAQEEQALHSIADEIESLSKEGDQYELIRTHKALPAILHKIYTHYKKTGEVLDTETVMNEIEGRLLERDLKLASIGKVKSKAAPETVVQPQPQSQGKQMKTLTNRDSAAIPMDRRARAIAAMQGTLRK